MEESEQNRRVFKHQPKLIKMLQSWAISHGNERAHKPQVDERYHARLRLFCETQWEEEI